MAFTDLTVANGWIPVEYGTDPLLKDVQVPAVEAVGRIVNMGSDQYKVPRFAAAGVDVVAEGALIPLIDPTLDSVILDAYKFANRFAISSEDEEDSVVDAFAAFKRTWLSNYAIKFDNAALGTTTAGNGTTRPFDSVYYTVGAGNRTATAGALTFEHLTEAVGEMEATRNGGLVIIAHPSMKMALRDLKDADGARVVATEGVLGAAVPTVFGHEVAFSYGARAHATASDAPSGNPLLIVAAKNELIVGVRSGPEAKVSSEEQWANDNIELKMRSRRAFALASADGARVVELTAGA